MRDRMKMKTVGVHPSPCESNFFVTISCVDFRLLKDEGKILAYSEITPTKAQNTLGRCKRASLSVDLIQGSLSGLVKLAFDENVRI